MIALCPINSYDQGFIGLEAIAVFALLITLAFPFALIYVLWKIFIPPSDLPAANILKLDPENSGENLSRFCWSGFPLWKPVVYFILAILTLIY